MYLAVTDKKIDRASIALKKENERKIKAFNELPFWKRLGNAKALLNEEIRHSWQMFGIWQERRIKRKSLEDPFIITW